MTHQETPSFGKTIPYKAFSQLLRIPHERRFFMVGAISLFLAVFVFAAAFVISRFVAPETEFALHVAAVWSIVIGLFTLTVLGFFNQIVSVIGDGITREDVENGIPTSCFTRHFLFWFIFAILCVTILVCASRGAYNLFTIEGRIQQAQKEIERSRVEAYIRSEAQRRAYNRYP